MTKRQKIERKIKLENSGEERRGEGIRDREVMLIYYSGYVYYASAAEASQWGYTSVTNNIVYIRSDASTVSTGAGRYDRYEGTGGGEEGRARGGMELIIDEQRISSNHKQQVVQRRSLHIRCPSHALRLWKYVPLFLLSPLLTLSSDSLAFYLDRRTQLAQHWRD